jgi:sugar lactone lactonase YvrE
LREATAPKTPGDGGPATQAQLCCPQGVAVDADGSLFISDTYCGRIRKVTPNGIISTIAQDDRMFPFGIAVDAAGNVYFADAGSRMVRLLRPVPK